MYFEHAGIDPAARRIVVVKSSQHFRAAYAPIAREILVVDSGGGMTTANLDVFHARKATDTVVDVHHEIARGKLVQLPQAQAAKSLLLLASRRTVVATEDLVVGINGQLQLRNLEAPMQ